MVPAAAAFGNSFTLPAVFLTALLPKALADRALGYAALFLLAWSPCLWSLGLALVNGQAARSVQAALQGNGSAAKQQLQQAEGAGPRPLYWREPRVVDITPITPQNSNAEVENQPDKEGPGWAEQLVAHPMTTKIRSFAAQVSM